MRIDPKVGEGWLMGDWRHLYNFCNPPINFAPLELQLPVQASDVAVAESRQLSSQIEEKFITPSSPMRLEPLVEEVKQIEEEMKQEAPARECEGYVG